MARRKVPGGGSKLEAKVAADLAALGLMEGCQRQYKFHPTRRWAADFAWPDTKVILEVNGGTYLQGRHRGAHSRGSRQRKDYEKWTSISLMGWRLILVDTVDVRKDIHVIRVLEALEKRSQEDSGAR